MNVWQALYIYAGLSNTFHFIPLNIYYLRFRDPGVILFGGKLILGFSFPPSANHLISPPACNK